MGNQIRTPRPFYKDGVLVTFFVENKIVHYRTFVSTNNEKRNPPDLLTGTFDNIDARKPFEVLTGIYEYNPDVLVAKTKELAPVDHKTMEYDSVFWASKISPNELEGLHISKTVEVKN